PLSASKLLAYAMRDTDWRGQLAEQYKAAVSPLHGFRADLLERGRHGLDDWAAQAALAEQDCEADEIAEVEPDAVAGLVLPPRARLLRQAEAEADDDARHVLVARIEALQDDVCGRLASALAQIWAAADCPPSRWLPTFHLCIENATTVQAQAKQVGNLQAEVCRLGPLAAQAERQRSETVEANQRHTAAERAAWLMEALGKWRQSPRPPKYWYGKRPNISQLAEAVSASFPGVPVKTIADELGKHRASFRD
uniref:hypothetical protein n=1 Tax=Chitinimonas sp. TaxID=1934313 RepID=UPI0035B36E34